MLAGVTHQEFWFLTPDEIHQSVEAYLRREDAAYLKIGVLATAVYNASIKKMRRQMKPSDFVPKRRYKKEQTPEQQLAILKNLAKVFGANVVKK